MQNRSIHFMVGGLIGLVAGEMLNQGKPPKIAKKARNVYRRGFRVINALRSAM